MNWLCWLLGHTTGNKLGGACHRCGEMWVCGKSLPDLWRDFQCWWPCWLRGHEWSFYHCQCARCDVTEERVQDGIVPPTLPELVRKWFRSTTDYVKGSNAREDRQRAAWRDYFVTIFGQRWGFQYSPLLINDKPYMTRYILYLGPINLRLHQFFRGDDDRAPHTHPWWFITFPFSPYREAVYSKGRYWRDQVVTAWRFHYRPASHEHIVEGRVRSQWTSDYTRDYHDYVPDHRPFWTFVIAGSKAQTWGFYPRINQFVPWWEFKP